MPTFSDKVRYYDDSGKLQTLTPHPSLYSHDISLIVDAGNGIAYYIVYFTTIINTDSSAIDTVDKLISALPDTPMHILAGGIGREGDWTNFEMWCDEIFHIHYNPTATSRKLEVVTENNVESVPDAVDDRVKQIF